MRGSFQACTLFAATAMGVVLSSSAMAQGADSSSDIVVTARRVEEKLQDVPISITVFNQEQINNRNIVNSADLGTYTPSLATNQRYGPEKASFAIRGFQQDLGTAPSVGVYFADVVPPRLAGSLAGGNGVGVGNLFDLQNIQVLKGPQGTLFGRNTTGGAVLLVPKKPNDNLGGYVEGSAGDYSMWRLQGALNIPLADTFKVRLGVDHMERDGYLKNHGQGPSRLADVNYTAARLSIVANLTPDLENYTIATYSHSDNHGTTPKMIAVNTGQFTSLNPIYAPTASSIGTRTTAAAQLNRAAARGDGWWDVESNEPDPKLNIEIWQVINTTTWTASDTLTVKNIASYGEYREQIRMDLNGDNALTPAGTPGASTTRLRTTPGYDNAALATFTDELQFQGNSSDGKLKWQAGGYMEITNPLGFSSQSAVAGLTCSNPDGLQCNGAPPINFGPGIGNVFVSTISRPYQKMWFRNHGLYAQATYNFTDQLALTGGFRYTWDRQTHRYDATAIGFPAANTPVYFCSNTARVRNADGTFPVFLAPNEHDRCNVTFTAKSAKPTWLINLDYKPNSDILLYAKWARGYRAAGVNSANIFFESWGPEKVDTYEAGAKTSFRGSWARGYFNIAGFYNNFRDQQIQHSLIRAPTSPLLGGFAIINAGKSRIWGIEVDSAATFFDSLRIEVGYTYLNTKILKLDPVLLTPEEQLFWLRVPPNSAENGQLGLSPENRVTVTGTYTLPLNKSIGEVSLGATFIHTDSQIALSPQATPFYRLPASDLLNLNASWNNVLGKPIDLSFFMTNTTNAKFPVSVVNAWGSYGFEGVLVNEPRMWGFRLKYRFGGA